jgi:hypothetical protein
MPNWKGFFSDPRTYQLPQVEFQAAYEHLAQLDPNMKEFAFEDHTAFVDSMRSKFNPDPAFQMQQALGPAGADIVDAFAPTMMGGAPAVDQMAEAQAMTEGVQGVAGSPIGQLIAAGGKMAKPWLESSIGTGAATYEGFGDVLGAINQLPVEIAQKLDPDNMHPLAKAALAPLMPALQLWKQEIQAVEGSQIVQDIEAGTAEQQTERGAAADQFRQSGNVLSRALFGDEPKKTIDDIWGEAKKGQFGNVPEYAYDAAVNAAITMAPIALLNAIPGVGQAAGGIMLLSQISGEQTSDVRAAGGEGQRSIDNVVDALIPSAMERIGLERVFSKLPKRLAQRGGLLGFMYGRGQNATESALIEWLTETGQQAWNIDMRRQSLGLPRFDPYTESERKELREAGAQGAIGGGALGGAAGLVTQTPQERAVQVDEAVTRFKRTLSPEEQALQGNIDLRPEPTPNAGETRHRETPTFLTREEAQQFVNEEPLDIESISARVGRPVEEISQEVDAAEQRVMDILEPQHKPAQPEAENEDVISAIGAGIEAVAADAEAQGQPELAAARRARIGQVQVVEPRTIFERGLKGLERIGKGRKVVLFTQPQVPGEPVHHGVFVRPGLIAIDVSVNRNRAPVAVLGTMFHEIVHDIKEAAPEVYQGVMEAIRKTNLWAQSTKNLSDRGLVDPSEDEIFAAVMEQPHVAVNVMQALADYANVADLAKAPGPVRAVAEYISKLFRTVAGKLHMTADSDRLNLRQMQRISALRLDPETRRNAARATLELVDMLKTEVPNAVQEAQEEVAVAEPETAPPIETPEGPQRPERLLARDITEEATTIPLDSGGTLEISRTGKNYTVVRKSASGKVTARKPFPNLKAAKAYVNSVAGTKYSMSFNELRRREGPTSPRTFTSVNEQIELSQKFREQYEQMLSLTDPFMLDTTRRERAAKAAKQAIDSMRILEPSDYTDEQRMFADFAQSLGITLTFYESAPQPGSFGFSIFPGQIWINTKADKKRVVSGTIVHEMIHDLYKRDPLLWADLYKAVRKQAPDMFVIMENYVRNSKSYQHILGNKARFNDEVLAHVMESFHGQFWSAVSVIARQDNAPPSFGRFLEWVGGLLRKMATLFGGTNLWDMLGIDIDLNDPADVIGMKFAEALKTEVREGEYSVYAPEKTEAAKGRLKTELTRVVGVPGVTPTARTEYARMLGELDVQIETPGGEQLPLFSQGVVGYPPAARTRSRLATWRARLEKLGELGREGRYWYESSAEAILEMTGGNVEDARKFARLIAVYSPEKLVVDNWHVALAAWHRYKAGYSKEEFLREKIGKYKVFHEKAAEILYENAPWEGEKTNSFFSNLIDIVTSGGTDRVTIDRWMMRLFGFSGDGPTDAQYAAMKKETERVAKELGVEPHQAQAMMWVYAKTVWMDIKPSVLAEARRRKIPTHVPRIVDGEVMLGKDGRPVMVKTPGYEKLYRQMFHKEIKRDLKSDPTTHPLREEALANYADGLRRKIAVVSMEAIPGVGWFKNLPGATLSEKVWFTIGVENAFTDEVGDIIGQVMGLYPIADINTMLLGNSAYYADGQIQLNPSRQIKYPAAAKRGAEYTFTWDAASKDQVKLAAVIRGMLTGQNSVAGYRVFKDPGPEGDRNMAELDIGAPFSPEQTEEIVKLVDAGQIALYPADNGMRFLNISDMPNLEFHKVVRGVAKQFRGKVSTFMADTFFIAREGTGETYADIIQGREQLLRDVEDRVADQLAKHYLEAQERGLGDAPEWAVARGGTEAALRRDAKEYPHYWHFSAQDVTQTGIKREFAGTGATGAERARFRYDPETGKLDPESAVIHLYIDTGKAEHQVVSTAKYINKVIAKLKLIPTSSEALTTLYRENDGDINAVMKRLRELGYDGMVDESRGFVQVNRDIDVSELSEGHELTAKERLAWKGALRLENIQEGEKYDHLRFPKLKEVKRADIEFIASVLKDDGTVYFPTGTDEAVVSQYFEEVRSTSVGLVATRPRRPQFSVSYRSPGPPVGEMQVVDDEQEFGTQYATGSGPGWSLPRSDRWDWFVKKVQDSFIRFKRLNDMFEDEGIFLGEGLDVRLAEELYHGKVQEATLRIAAKYQQPLMLALRELAASRPESYTEILKKFDLYLHAAHAKERNAHIREVWRERKLTLLQLRKGKLQDKLQVLNDELASATDQAHIDRLNNSIRRWEAKLVKLEERIVAVTNQKELNSGLSDTQADVIMQQTRQEGLIGEFGKLAGQYVYPMLTERMQAWVAAGIITQKEYDNTMGRYKHYVPLKGRGSEGDIEEVIELYGFYPSSPGFDVRGAALPFVTGREEDSKVNPILAQSFVDAMRAVDLIERNRVAVALLELAEAHPNDNLWEVNKEVKKRVYDKKTGVVNEVQDWLANQQANVVGAKRNGETFYIHLKDRYMIEAMKGLGVENLWKWVRAVRAVMRTMAQLYTTWSPEFILTNFARDWQQAIVSASTDMGAKAAAEVAKESSRAVRGILAANFPDTFGFLTNDYTDAYHEFKETGARIGFFGMNGIEDMQKAILSNMNSGAVATTMRGLRNVGNYIGAINEATENGLRLATYVVAQRHGASKAKAASLAKNITVNFNRRGDIGGAVGAMYLFFNAGVQGVDRFFKSMQTPAGKKLAAFYVGLGFLTSVWSRAVMGDDDDGEDRYDKVTNFTKLRHWILGIPGTDGEFVQISLPYGFGIWAQLGKELEHMMFSGQDRGEAAGEAAVRMLAGLTTHFSPLGETSFEKSGYAMTRPIIPTLIEPWTDVLANETYWGGRIYPMQAPWDKRSDSARHYPAKTASEKVLIAATEKLNQLTGGSEYRPGVIDLNANALAYVLDSYIGPAGKFFAQRPFDLGKKLITGEETVWNDWMILRRFLSETSPQYYVPGEFYDAVDDVQRAEEEREYLKKNGDAEDYARWDRKHGWKLGLVKESERAQRLLRDWRKRPDSDSKEARDRALAVQRAFVKRYLQAEER